MNRYAWGGGGVTTHCDPPVRNLWSDMGPLVLCTCVHLSMSPAKHGQGLATFPAPLQTATENRSRLTCKIKPVWHPKKETVLDKWNFSSKSQNLLIFKPGNLTWHCFPLLKNLGYFVYLQHFKTIYSFSQENWGTGILIDSSFTDLWRCFLLFLFSLPYHSPSYPCPPLMRISVQIGLTQIIQGNLSFQGQLINNLNAICLC